MSEPTLEDDLAAWGKVVRLHTTGRRSGRDRSVTVGYVEEDGGAIVVASSSEATGWAANLRSTPDCVVELDGHQRASLAIPLRGSDRAAAIARLILKYGTPAERLGAGPAFRLLPRGSSAGPARSDYTDAHTDEHSR